ncbi:MAG: hypothetical protein MZU97_24765 [Bacillus subtilis]|nr:hypothetical protein [Bacillus subtilis]
MRSFSDLGSKTTSTPANSPAMDAVAQTAFVTEFQNVMLVSYKRLHQAHPSAKMVVTYGLTGEARQLWRTATKQSSAKARNLGIVTPWRSSWKQRDRTAMRLVRIIIPIQRRTKTTLGLSKSTSKA